MKIGIDASRANRDFKTGTEWYSYYLITNLVKLDKENKYILYSDKCLSDSFLSDLNLEENKHVEVKVLNWPFKFFWTLGRFSLEMLVSRPDILFVPAHTVPFFSPKKTITTIHDVAFRRDKCLYEKDVVLIEGSIIKKIIRFFIKIFTAGTCKLRSSDHLNWSTTQSLKRAKKIISVSHFTKNEILNFYKIKEEKISVVYNGYNSSIYRKIENESEVDEILNSYGLKKPYFLYVGRIEKKKNIKLLVEAFYNFKEKNKDRKEKLVLVGNRGFAYDEISYLISELDLYQDIIMPGWVEEKDMPHIFNGAEAFVFPSLHEGFGIPLLQAMACGVPVIASDIEVFKEIAQDVPYFFDRYNYLDLSDKMENLIKNKNKQIEMSSKGLELVKNFSWEKCAKEILEEIKRL